MEVLWALNELELEYTRHNIGGSFGGNKEESYLKLNPNGLVPTIRDDDLVLWESNSIVRYLSRKFGQGVLLPENEKQVAKADQWMDWCKTAVYPSFMPVFWGLIRTPKENQNPSAIARSVEQSATTFAVLENHLDNNDYLAGDAFSMGDIPVGVLVYRYLNLDIDRPEFPNIHAWYGRLTERKAYQEHVMRPFGKNLDEWMRLEKESS